MVDPLSFWDKLRNKFNFKAIVREKFLIVIIKS